MDYINPGITADDLFQPKENTSKAKTERTTTPAGTYSMTVAGNLAAVKTSTGKLALSIFFKHADQPNFKYKGVGGRVLFTGTDKNGNPCGKQFGDLLAALGVSEDQIVAARVAIEDITALETADFKGVPAYIVDSADDTAIDVLGVTCRVVVDDNGRASGFYPAK